MKRETYQVHIYDFLNKNKLAQYSGAEYLSLNISHSIDDFSTATLTFNQRSRSNETQMLGFENVYIEDSEGNIIFGGLLVSFQITENVGSMTLYDHRWVLSRLILDQVVTLDSSKNVLDVVEELITAAKAKRSIPLEFYRDGSAFNPDYTADLRFEIGDDIGSCMQKIIQTTYSRWAVRYTRQENEIFGRLIVRSVRGVTPEGVGIARGFHHTEDGEFVHLIYVEGEEHNNIQSFNLVQDLSQMTTRSKLGAKIGGESKFYNSTSYQTDPYLFQLEFYYGRTEGYASDYKANSAATGRTLANLNQTLPRIDADVVLAPNFTRYLNCGDRVSMSLKSPMIIGLDKNTVRIDAISYTSKDGYLERRMFINFMSPQKRPGTNGLLQQISDMQQKLDGLDKNYLNR